MPDYTEKKFYFTVEYRGGSNIGPVGYYLPMYPDEISDTSTANWSTQPIIGRSAPLVTYSSTEPRSVSFTLVLHRELQVSESSTIENIARLLRASVYPMYPTKGISIPITKFVFGNFVVRGVLRSVGFSWKAPIINDNYQVCEASISIDDYPEKIVSAADIRNGHSMNPFSHNKSK